MGNTTVRNIAYPIADSTVKTNYNGAVLTPQRNINNPEIERLIAEGGKNFFHYLNYLGLTNDPNMLVLSSKHHYYYDHNELKFTTTLINLKQLNLIKHIDSFLFAIYHFLSPGANFIGYFFDSNTRNETGLTFRMYERCINFLDSKIDRKFDRSGVSRLLESHGFQVNDMTTIDGLTYFRTQTIRRPVVKPVTNFLL